MGQPTRPIESIEQSKENSWDKWIRDCVGDGVGGEVVRGSKEPITLWSVKLPPGRSGEVERGRGIRTTRVKAEKLRHKNEEGEPFR